MLSNKKNKENNPWVESQAAFAKRLGVNRSTVSRAIKAGRILTNQEGKVRIKESLASWQASKSHKRPDVEQRNKQQLVSAEVSEWALDLGELAEIEAQRIDAENKIKRINHQLDRGELRWLHDEQIAQKVQAIQIKHRLEALLDSLSARLLPLNAAERLDLIEDQVKQLHSSAS